MVLFTATLITIMTKDVFVKASIIIFLVEEDTSLISIMILEFQWVFKQRLKAAKLVAKHEVL